MFFFFGILRNISIVDLKEEEKECFVRLKEIKWKAAKKPESQGIRRRLIVSNAIELNEINYHSKKSTLLLILFNGTALKKVGKREEQNKSS